MIYRNKHLEILFLFVILPNVSVASEVVEVKILWNTNNFTPRINLYEVPKDKHVRLWETKSVKAFSDVPAGKRIADSRIIVSKGSNKKFIVVAQNKSNKPVYFFAAPHIATPFENTLGFKFRCLCINHAFSIGPKEIWYRVVQFKISENMVGDKLTILHSLVGIDKERMEKFKVKRSLIPVY